MGELYEAKCKNCGKRYKDLLVGPGMIQFDKKGNEINYYPGVDYRRKRVVSRNFLDIDNSFDKNFEFYNNVNLLNLVTSTKIAELIQNQDELPTLEELGEVYCPSCNHFNLLFTMVGLWD